MYHVELRQFPHNMCRFNLTSAELQAIVEPWAREKVVDFGERKWSSQTARITILDGPRIPLQQLTMGRGWRAAQRQSTDVTEQVLAAAREALAPAHAGTGAPVDPLTLGAQLASLLGDDPARLLFAWKEIAARSSGLAPSETLALAERQVGA
jgi:hypothetical protein